MEPDTEQQRLLDAIENPSACFQGDNLVREAGGWRCRVCDTLWPQGGVVWMGDDQVPLGDDETLERTDVSCGEPACERSCTDALLAAQAADFPRVQARAQRLYAAYVAALGPLGTALPPWHDLIERSQYAWRCVVRAGEGEA